MLLPLKIKVSKKQKIQELINRAPYFKEAPMDVEMILNQTVQDFEIKLPKIIDEDGDNFTVEAKNLPDKMTLSNSMILAKGIDTPGVFRIRLTLKDTRGKSNNYEM